MGIKDIFAKLSGKTKDVPSETSEEPRKVVNGYLQTSNRKVISPVYSNTREARAAQEAKVKTPQENDRSK